MEKTAKPGIEHRCEYRIVWCSKYRRRVLTSLDPDADAPVYLGDDGPIDTRLAEIITSTCAEYPVVLHDLTILPDRVDMRIGVDPQFGLHRFVKLVKARSSKLLRSEFPSLNRRVPTLWTNSYFVTSVGVDDQDAVTRYVTDQRHV